MDAIISAAISSAREMFIERLQMLPPEDGRRLASLEGKVKGLTSDFAEELWRLVDEELGRQAEAEAWVCDCGRKRQKNVSDVRVSVGEGEVVFHCVYFYCRKCCTGDAPMRRWLGIHSGQVSMGVERDVTNLTTKLTFGESAKQMEEHHGQEMDRTKLERVTYNVGEEAVEYLAERRDRLRRVAESSARTTGAELVELMADGGGVRTCKLTRPEPGEGVPLTPSRQLPRGNRNIARREVRLVTAKRPGMLSERVTDLHIAPYNQTEVSGERMLYAAMEVGLRDNTHIHGVFDMGRWIHTQFEEQFREHDHSAVADIIHVTEYLHGAARNIVDGDQTMAWAKLRKGWLLEGRLSGVLRGLSAHKCTSACKRDDEGTCLTKVARRYLRNSRKYLDYPDALERGFSIGSGEAESGIRHLVRSRMDVAGAWDEGNAILLLALISIRASGWWNDFWKWRNQRDIQRWHQRQTAQHGRNKAKQEAVA